jgi:hypothetical protein
MEIDDSISKENKEKQRLIQINKYGSIFLNDQFFNHNEEIGENYLYYKPEEITIYIGKKNDDDVLSGIEILYRNILNGSKKKCNKGVGHIIKSYSKFIIKPTEYLNNFRIWIGDDVIYKVSFKTNKGKEFEIGESKGEEMIIDKLDGNNIIMSFCGNYNNYLTSLGIITIEKDKYIQILFTGYFELKALLKKEDKRKEVIENIEKGIYKQDDLALIKTCLLPDNPFNGIIKYCIV